MVILVTVTLVLRVVITAMAATYEVPTMHQALY